MSCALRQEETWLFTRVKGGLRRIFRYEDGIVPNLMAMAFIVAGYAGGFLLLFSKPVWVWTLGVLILAESMIISAYFLHELVHHTIFRSKALNARVLAAISWVNGACLSSLARTEKKHLAHHIQKADIISFDFREWLKGHPVIRRGVAILEWAYFPAVEILMRVMMVIQPFSRSLPHRYRLLTTFIIRSGLWVWLLYWHWPAALGYALSLLIMISVLRFVDAFQHTYDAFVAEPGSGDPDIPRRNAAYEEEHTYSNLLSVRWPVCNLLTLNFVYHNAHHALPSMPWHRLRKYHESCYPLESRKSSVLPLKDQLISYHRYRVMRATGQDGPSGQQDFMGAVGVSFLTVF